MKTYRNRCVLRLSRLSNVALGVEIERIQTALDQSEFTDIYPSTAEVRLVLSQYVECQQECSARNYKLVPARDAKKQELLEMLRTQCDGVNYLSKGDETKLKSSGFELLRAPENATLPREGNILRIAPHNNLGSFSVTVQPAKKPKYYIIRVVDSNGVAHNFTSSKHKFILDGFAIGSTLKISTATSNTAGEGPWSRIQDYSVTAYSVVQNPTNPTNDKNMRVA